tara:strand:+ start:1492 stop:1605 length:114 start_codon:yes stop_codon:yes gene_type:complete
MTKKEEYELIELGFSEEEIKEIKKAEKAAKKDIKAGK